MRGKRFGDLGKEWVNEVGHHEADERTAAGDQGLARRQVRAIVQASEPLQDFLLCLFGDIGAVA